MATEAGFLFLDDAPKRDPASDLLGHAPFAERLASILRSIAAPEGYVIGLHGAWGSGKSSVLNFVCSSLERSAHDAGTEAPVVIRFEPWIVSGHQDLTAAFMKVLIEQMPGGIEPRWRRWGRRVLRGASAGSSDIVDAAAKIGVMVDHTGGIASGAAGGIAKKAVGAAASRWLKEPSLQFTYETLVKRLRSEARRYVVIVDDIDRLTADEIRDLMRMVKTVGKLPNVTYLLSYDRSIVWGALGGLDPRPSEGDFAEKIIQQEIELPAPSRSTLLAMLSDVLGFMALGENASERRAQLVDAGIARWIRRPRDVVRLSNGLRFAYAALKGEIDPDDLICMEGLRLYDRALFEWIRDNRELLVEPNYLAEEVSGTDPGAFSEIAGRSRARARDLMAAMFPNRSKLFANRPLGGWGESWTSVMARRGVATKAGYDAYFALHPADAAIPKEQVDTAVGSLSDQSRLEGILREAIERLDPAGNTLAGDLIEELRGRIELGAPATPELLTALVRLGSAITGAPWHGDILGPRAQLHFLITALYRKWSDGERFANLLAAFRAAPPLASMAAVYVDLARATGRLPREGVERENLLIDEQLDELGAIVVERIHEDRQSGGLDEQPVYHDIAFAWASMSGFDEPRAWLSSIGRSDPSRLARVASGIL